MRETKSPLKQFQPRYQSKKRGSQEQKDEPIDTQAAFAKQFFLDEQQHWADSYGGDTDEQPPTRGGTTVKSIKPVSMPKPRPGPVNNPK
ncbi:hypothetical protein F5Y14DRAFT_431989 [Nemania sp. NC0429]|nr:hypothetical protein F5Y14DRAFT_431989 [Nemania sp. NC0429]